MTGREHEQEPEQSDWRVKLWEHDDGWSFRIDAPDGRSWSALRESFALAASQAADLLRSVPEREEAPGG